MPFRLDHYLHMRNALALAVRRLRARLLREAENTLNNPGILILGDSRPSQALAELLTDSAEFSVHVADNAAAARGTIAAHDIATCIVCEEWAAHWIAEDAPAHVLSLALMNEPYLRTAQQTGTVHDESLSCPFSLIELLTMLRSLLRRYELETGLRYRIGSRIVDPVGMHVEDENGRRIRLTRMELRLLNELYRCSGTAVSRAGLLERVWGYSRKIVTSTLDTHIYSLRQKIEMDPRCPTHVVSDNGGYRLNADPKMP